MKSVCLIIIDRSSPSEILQKLKGFDFSELQITILILSRDKNIEESSGHWQHDEKIHFQIVPFPDDEFNLKDLLQYNKSEKICFFSPSLNYPFDYFQRTINRQPNKEETQAVKRIGTLTERTLKATQQSKFGLGILKKDIKRDFSELKSSAIYQVNDLNSANILELHVDDDLPEEILKWAEKTKIKSISYHPDYKKIEYYRDLDSFISAVRKEAPYLRFREKEEANGLPLYLLIFVWLSLVLAVFFPVGILIFLVFLAIYSLALSLEALAISTLKRQGELFIGLLLFFPFLHHIYLFSYFSSLIVGKKPD